MKTYKFDLKELKPALDKSDELRLLCEMCNILIVNKKNFFNTYKDNYQMFSNLYGMANAAEGLVVFICEMLEKAKEDDIDFTTQFFKNVKMITSLDENVNVKEIFKRVFENNQITFIFDFNFSGIQDLPNEASVRDNFLFNFIFRFLTTQIIPLLSNIINELYDNYEKSLDKEKDFFLLMVYIGAHSFYCEMFQHLAKMIKYKEEIPLDKINISMINIASNLEETGLKLKIGFDYNVKQSEEIESDLDEFLEGKINE